MAWERRIPVISLGRNEELSNGAVNSIIRDSEGYFWMGTWNGLNRWDGHSMEVFFREKPVETFTTM
ncbi:MAG: two-component regulator propeller domain-containing protein [Bacteroidales bacterium]